MVDDVGEVVDFCLHQVDPLVNQGSVLEVISKESGVGSEASDFLRKLNQQAEQDRKFKRTIKIRSEQTRREIQETEELRVLGNQGRSDIGHRSIKDKMLTVAGNRSTLEQLEAVRALEGGDLAMGEFCKEFRLLVVGHVDIGLRELDVNPCPGGGSANLNRIKSRSDDRTIYV